MEGFAMFENMIAAIEDDVAKFVMKAEIENNLEREEVIQGQTTASLTQLIHRIDVIHPFRIHFAENDDFLKFAHLFRAVPLFFLIVFRLDPVIK